MPRFVRFALWAVAALVLLVAAYVFVLSGSFHEPTDRFAPGAYAGPAGPVIVFGGNKGTGLEIARKLRARGEAVTVVVRRSSDTTRLKSLGVTIVIADALHPAEVRGAFAANVFQAVISTLGTSKPGEVRPDFDGNRNVIDAARSAGVRRMVLVSVIGAGDSQGSAPFPMGSLLKEVIAIKTRAEDYLKGSGLAYTIIRPGWLGTGRASGAAFLTEDRRAFSYIARADLAELVVEALGSPAAVGRTFAAYDATHRTAWSILADRGNQD
jgi:uncharacterized protein YbjT (DUF2867 family)